MPGHSFIYQLVDPRTSEPRYVGLTNDPQRRLGNHAWDNRKTEAEGGAKNRPVYRWWRDVASVAGHSPVLRVIAGPVRDDQRTDPAGDLEESWENAHRIAGVDLVNSRKCGGRRRLGGGYWTYELARAEALKLVAKLGLGQSYPTQSQFNEHGPPGLHDFIKRQEGGHAALARNLGLTMYPPGSQPKRDAATARVETLELVAKLGLGQSYPTQEQFNEHGPSGLYGFIQRQAGGHRAFAQSLGLTMYPTGFQPKRDAATARAETLELVAKLGLGQSYPTQSQFNEHGPPGLYGFIKRQAGGHRAFAQSLGLTMSPKRAAATARAETLELLEKLGLGRSYPTRVQFREHGPRGLYDCIERYHGGHAAFARTLGLQRPERARRDVETARGETLALVAELELGQAYPMRSQFDEHAPAGLYQFIQRQEGGPPAFARNLGLRPRRPGRPRSAAARTESR